jgi:CheY-like chemotaxis protein
MVEDDPDDVFAFKRMIKKMNSPVQLSVVSNGKAALEYLERKGGFEKLKNEKLPDLILLDLNMPIMNGKEVLVEIKQQKELASIPVIVFTTSKFDDEIRVCYELGASSYLVKPASVQDFESTLNSLLDYWINHAELPQSVH